MSGLSTFRNVPDYLSEDHCSHGVSPLDHCLFCRFWRCFCFFLPERAAVCSCVSQRVRNISSWEFGDSQAPQVLRRIRDLYYSNREVTMTPDFLGTEAVQNFIESRRRDFHV